MNYSPVRMAIEALEHLMDEQEKKWQAKHVVLLGVFVGQRCVCVRTHFFLDADPANHYYNDLVHNIQREALFVDRDASRATVSGVGVCDAERRA